MAKIQTTHKVINTLNGCIITTYWADIPVRTDHYCVSYNGGDLEEFAIKNYKNMLFGSTNWDGINKFNELYGYNPDTKI